MNKNANKNFSVNLIAFCLYSIQIYINMINKYSYFWRNRRYNKRQAYYPRYQPYVSNFPSPNRQSIHRSQSQIQTNNLLNNYIFRKYEINHQIQSQLIQLQKQIACDDEDFTNEEIVAFRKTFDMIEDGLITQLCMNRFRNIYNLAKQKNIIIQNKLIDNKLTFNIDNSNQRFSSTFFILKQYRFNQSKRLQNSKILLKQLQLSTQIQIALQDYLEAFQSLKLIQVLNSTQRKIRLLLMRRIRSVISGLQIGLLIKISKVVNMISHYDFLPEELQIAQQILSKIRQKRNELEEKIWRLKELFEGKQYPLNTSNLSQLFDEIITYLIDSKKRINSNEAHEAFSLIVLANEKIKSYLLTKKKYQQFLLRYIQVSGKTKKHQQNINKGLQILICKNCLPLPMLKKLTIILQKINFDLNIYCIYNLIVNENNSVIKFMDKEQKDKLLNQIKYTIEIQASKFTYLRQYLISFIPIYKSGLQISPKYWKINKQKEIQQFFPKINIEMEKQFKNVNIANIYSDCLSIYKKQIYNFVNNPKELPIQSQYEEIIPGQHLKVREKIYQSKIVNEQLIYFLIKSFSFQNDEIQIIEKLLTVNSQSIIVNILTDRLKKYQNEGLQNYLILPYFVYIQNISILNMDLHLLIINLLTRLSKNIRENNMSKAAKFHYWMQVTNVFDKFTLHFIESREALFNLIEQLLTPFNTNTTEYWLNSNFYHIIQTLLSQYTIFSQEDQVRQLIIKNALDYNLINREHGVLDAINLENLDQVSIEKIKYLKDSNYCSKIDEINQQSLQIILFNHNLHHLLDLHKNQINQIISNASNKQLQQYIINFNQLILQSSSSYKLANIVKTLGDKIQPNNFNKFMVFTHIEKKHLFNLDQSYFLLMKWIQYFTINSQKIGDLQTHQIILTLLTRFQHKKNIEINKYIKILFKQLSIYPMNYYKELFYHKLISTNYQFSRQELAQMAQASQPFLVPSLFFFLEHQFLEEQRRTLIGKIINMAEKEYQQKADGIDKIQVISDYQYRYLKQRYGQYFITELTEKQFHNEVFSQFVEKDRELLSQIAKYKQSTLNKLTDFGHNQIYQINNHYIINFLSFKQSSIYEFYYYERLLKAFYGSNIKVTITLFDQQNSYVDIGKITKLNALLTEDQWQELFFMRTVKQNQEHQVQEQTQEQEKRQRKKQQNIKKHAAKNKKLPKIQYRKERKVNAFKKNVKK